MPKWIVKLCQIIVYPLVYIPFRILYKNELSLKIKFNRDEKYIFVPNHPARIDPLLMFYIIPFKDLIKILPIRFMTGEKYMRNKISFFFLGLMGCYKIDKEAVKNSERLLRDRNNLCIFLQGKIEDSRESSPKVGALRIERAVKDSYIVPVKIKYSGDKFRKRAEITFKQKFRHKKFPKDLQPLTNKLLRDIKK